MPLPLTVWMIHRHPIQVKKTRVLQSFSMLCVYHLRPTPYEKQGRSRQVFSLRCQANVLATPCDTLPAQRAGKSATALVHWHGRACLTGPANVGETRVCETLDTPQAGMSELAARWRMRGATDREGRPIALMGEGGNRFTGNTSRCKSAMHPSTRSEPSQSVAGAVSGSDASFSL